MTIITSMIISFNFETIHIVGRYILHNTVLLLLIPHVRHFKYFVSTFSTHAPSLLAHTLLFSFTSHTDSRFLGSFASLSHSFFHIFIPIHTHTHKSTNRYSYYISHMKSISVKSVFGCRSHCENTENQIFLSDYFI